MGKVKAIMYGMGATGRLATKLLVEKGVEIVGAVGNKSNLGKDIGELAELGYPLGVSLSGDADGVLSQQKADVVLVCSTGSMADMFQVFEKCIKNKLNVISIAEEAFFPWRSSHQLACEVDKLAKQYGVTVTASGVQDVFWVNLISVLTAASHSIDQIEGETTANVDVFGPVVLNEIGVGKDPSEISQLSEKPDKKGTHIFQIGLEALAADLELSIKEVSNRKVQIIAERDIESKGLGRTIKRGQIQGVSEITEIVTHQGITLQGKLTGKVFDEGDAETNTWVIKGVPEIHLENKHMPGQLATCTSMINRIRDIISCKPGFVTVEKLPKPKYQTFEGVWPVTVTR
jgi:4-hydroxy-tetrahydrodipicolinate reductase